MEAEHVSAPVQSLDPPGSGLPDLAKMLLVKPTLYNGQSLQIGTMLMPTARFEELPSFKGRVDDVYVISFPKSGTHWVMDIAAKVALEGDLEKAKDVPRPFLEAAPPPEIAKHTEIHRCSLSLAEIANTPSPRIIGTHLWYDNLPEDIRQKNYKMIYVWRDWRDCVVSKYRMMKKATPAATPPWDQFYQMELTPEALFGTWPDHIKHYQKHAGKDNVLVLRYEDMKKDLLTAVKKIAEFLKTKLSEECLERIANSCTIEATKKAAPNSMFVNKGITGEWTHYFSEEQAKRTEEEITKAGLTDTPFQ